MGLPVTAPHRAAAAAATTTTPPAPLRSMVRGCGWLAVPAPDYLSLMIPCLLTGGGLSVGSSRPMGGGFANRTIHGVLPPFPERASERLYISRPHAYHASRYHVRRPYRTRYSPATFLHSRSVNSPRWNDNSSACQISGEGSGIAGGSADMSDQEYIRNTGTAYAAPRRGGGGGGDEGW